MTQPTLFDAPPLEHAVIQAWYGWPMCVYGPVTSRKKCEREADRRRKLGLPVVGVVSRAREEKRSTKEEV